MSTKIHNGYRLAADTHPAAFADQVRAVLGPLVITRADQGAVRRAVAAIDAGDHHEVEAPRRPLFAAVAEMDDEHRERGAWGCEVVLVCDHTRRGDGRWYALLYPHGNDRLVEAFAGLDAVEPWPYWNNTDRPDEISVQDWEQRRRTWDRLLGWDAPAERGLTIDLLPDGPGLPRAMVGGHDRLLEMVPGRRERAEGIARSRVLSRLIDQEGMEATRAVMQVLRAGGPHHEELAGVADEVAPRLREITVEVLLSGTGDEGTDAAN